MCGMVSNVSTVVFRSNLYPVRKDFRDDSVFRSKIHDPFSLEILKKQYFLTNLQELEYNRASVHCLYAAPKDYPWGTIRNANGHDYSGRSAHALKRVQRTGIAVQQSSAAVQPRPLGMG